LSYLCSVTGIQWRTMRSRSLPYCNTMACITKLLETFSAIQIRLNTHTYIYVCVCVYEKKNNYWIHQPLQNTVVSYAEHMPHT
jgi:hypothetical protein